MPGPVAGMFSYLYLIVDIFSRKIVGWEVHERETADLAAMLIEKAAWAEAHIARPLVLHADNGSPMKGATMKVTLKNWVSRHLIAARASATTTRSPGRCSAPANIARTGQPRALPPRPMLKSG